MCMGTAVLDIQITRHNVMKELNEVYVCMGRWADGGKQDIGFHARRFFSAYTQMARYTHTDPEQWIFWRMTPKFHLLLHLTEEQCLRAGSPKDVWCYSDEREIGAAARLAASVSNLNLNIAIIRRYRLMRTTA
jgi:hypothetical protein